MEGKNDLPILALRCKDCGKVYLAQALAYPIDEDTAGMIAEAVKYGDEPFICTEVKLECCTCKKPLLCDEQE